MLLLLLFRELSFVKQCNDSCLKIMHEYNDGTGSSTATYQKLSSSSASCATQIITLIKWYLTDRYNSLDNVAVAMH